MYTFENQAGWDNLWCAIPSEYMINKMKDEDLLVPLDYSKIEGSEEYLVRGFSWSFDP